MRVNRLGHYKCKKTCSCNTLCSSNISGIPMVYKDSELIIIDISKYKSNLKKTPLEKRQHTFDGRHAIFCNGDDISDFHY